MAINLRGWKPEYSKTYSTTELGLVKQALTSMNSYDFVQVQGTFLNKKYFKFNMYKLVVDNTTNVLRLQDRVSIALTAPKVIATVGTKISSFTFEYSPSLKTILIFRR